MTDPTKPIPEMAPGIALSNEELDLLDELVSEGFGRLGLSDVQTPPEGSFLNRAGWLVNLKFHLLELRDARIRSGHYPLFGK